jgi:hypothetical protein
MSRSLIGLCTLLLLATFTPSTARADTIVITSGSLTVAGIFQGASYSFAGQNFAVAGGGGDPGSVAPTQCFPCVSGASINVNTFLVGSSLGQGTVTINGTTYNNVFIAGTFSFSGASVTVPNVMSAITLTSPFSFSGLINGCQVSHLLCTSSDVVFTTQLTGSGTAFIDLTFFQTPSGLSLFQFQRVRYDFGDSTNPVPEPMSLLLLAGGLATLGAAKLKRVRGLSRRMKD